MKDLFIHSIGIVGLLLSGLALIIHQPTLELLGFIATAVSLLLSIRSAITP